MPAIGWYNGTIGRPEEISVPINDRAVYFGDGVYEACLAIGTKPFGLVPHIDRFYRSLSLLSIPFDMSKEALIKTLTDCLKAAGEQSAALYWQASRATAPRTHAFPTNGAKPNLLITVTPKQAPNLKSPMRLILSDDVRYAMCHVKTLNLIPNVLASERAHACGADEAVFVRDGFVTEGSHTNVHIVKDGTLFTHPTDQYILPGVTRGYLLSIAKQAGIPVTERAFTVEELKAADEILISSSTLGVRRAITLDGVPVGGRDERTLETVWTAYERIFQEETGA